MPKTASTFLQSKVFPFFRNVDYWQTSQGTFARLIFRTSHEKILLSHESFQGAVVRTARYKNPGWLTTREARLGILANMFPAANTILVVRRHVEWLSSMYRQYLHQGGVATFEEFFSPTADMLVEREGLRYEAFVDDLRRKFSGELLCIDYDAIRKNLQSVIASFESFLGEPCEGKFVNSAVNPSVKGLQAKLLRRVNQFSESLYDDTGKTVIFRRSGVLHKLRLTPAEIVRRLEFLGRYSSDVVTPEQIRAANDYYKSDWDWMLSQVGDRGAGVMDPYPISTAGSI
ncbi:MAG: sulfotransferase [Burkholderiaceae bacterium]|nr:sulfotransferase [Burkholderiaceae bacterium]